MSSVKQKTCSGCGELFTCGPQPGDTDCWCHELPHVSLIANANHDCFCPQCLGKAIQNVKCASSEDQVALPREICLPAPVAGEDYYWEGEKMVFTARYHLRRGYCCESGCRHCPYRESEK